MHLKTKIGASFMKELAKNHGFRGSSSIPFYYEKNAKFYIKTSSLIF